MKHALKRALSLLPGGVSLLEAWTRMRFRDSEALFTHYFRQNVWGDPESVSGSHSTIRYTANIRQQLPPLFDRLDVRTILDAPCGDYNWFRLVPRHPETLYIGADIVKPLIAANQAAFANSNTSFVRLDLVRDPLPPVDLWICRDCLFHFSNERIFLTLRNFLRSPIRYFLTTTYPHAPKNTDIPTGKFRLLNLERPPFCLGQPLLRIDDWIEGHPVKQLALWERAALAETLRAHPVFAESTEPGMKGAPA